MNLIPPDFEADLRRLDVLLAPEPPSDRNDPPLRSDPPFATAGGPWEGFVRRLNLDAFERDLVLLVLAPDLDPRYGALYDCLIGSTRPTLAWAMRLFAPGDAWRLRDRIGPNARLFRLGLLIALDGGGVSPWLGRPIVPHPKLVEALAFGNAPASPPEELPVPAAIREAIGAASRLPQGSTFHLEGSDPVLVRRCAEVVAGHRGLTDDPILALASGAVLLAEAPPKDTAFFSLVLTHGTEPTGPHGRLEIPRLDADRRAAVWRSELTSRRIEADPVAVAERYELELGQIVAAAEWVSARSEPPDLLRAAAAQTIGAIAELAQPIVGTLGWNDLVVPEATARRLRIVESAIERRRLVIETWEFGLRVGSQGLKALFTGPSGTGKTMAAGVIGRDLGVPVFRVDLASTLSKYIGETEKNLARVFDAAAHSGAILFFDEADALFGKRSEVKDAHDRYANVEASYLLQRMEDYAGAVILATNLSRNIDEAFSRRMHYVVEFPIPDAALRRRLRYGMFPAAAPLGSDVDLDFLAQRFELPGGRIQTVVLDAAFMAAREGSAIGMRHLVRATAHQLVKEGRIPSPIDFGLHYEAAVSPGEP